MANEEDEKKSPDEYQYPEEYYSGEEYKPSEEGGETGTEEGVEEEAPVVTHRRRRLFYALGVIGAIAVVYAILTFTTRQKSPEVTQVTPTAPPPVQAVAPAAPVQAVVTPTPTVSATEERSMQEQLRSNQQAIANLQNQMQQLQSDLSQLTENLTTLTGQIQIIANQIKALDSLKSIQESKKLLRFPMMQIYHLKALVPGRAWLQSLNGQVNTVTIGDRLPGYGIIQSIDTEQGIVTTSSGKLIQYGPRDS